MFLLISRYLLCSFLSFALASAALASAYAYQDQLQRAVQFLSEQKIQEARHILEEMQETLGGATPISVYYHLSVCYLKLEEWKKAESALNHFLELAPQDSSAIHLKAHLLFRTGRYTESVSWITSYLQKNPNSASAHKLLGLNQYMLGRSDAALAELKCATVLNPQDSEAFYYLGRLYFTRSNLKAALSAFEKVIELDPASVKAYNHLGQTYEGMTEATEAERAYLKAIELEQNLVTKSEWPYFNLGVLYMDSGRTEEAIAYLQQSLARNPSFPQGKVKLAVALASLGNSVKAFDLLNEAIKTDPQNAEAHYRLALLLSKSGRREEAAPHFVLFEKLRKP